MAELVGHYKRRVEMSVRALLKVQRAMERELRRQERQERLGVAGIMITLHVLALLLYLVGRC